MQSTAVSQSVALPSTLIVSRILSVSFVVCPDHYELNMKVPFIM